MAKDPAFPFYASDFLGSEAAAIMSNEELGAYVRLLAHQWCNVTCSLPDDDEMLSRLSGMGEGWLKGGSHLVRRWFPPNPDQRGRLSNVRLLKCRQDRDEWIEKSREGGRKSGERRKLRETNHPSTTLSTKGQPNSNTPSPSPSPSPLSSSSLSSSPKKGFAAQNLVGQKPDLAADVRSVFDHYRTYHPRACPKPKSTSKEWKAIKDRSAEGFTVGDLCEAIDGCHKTPFNLGANDQGQSYLGLALIVRDADHVNRFIENARHPPTPRNEREVRTLSAASRWLERGDT